MTYKGMFSDSPFFKPLSDEEILEEKKAIKELQDAEEMLLHYIITTAAWSDTPLSVTRAMADFLGKPQDLPSGIILEAVSTIEKTDPGAIAVRLAFGLQSSQQEDNLNGEHTKNGRQMDPDGIASDSDLMDEAPLNNWISIYRPEIPVEERLERLHREAWREPEPFQGHKKDVPKPRPKRSKGQKALILIAVVLAAFVAFKGEKCAGPANMARIKALFGSTNSTRTGADQQGTDTQTRANQAKVTESAKARATATDITATLTPQTSPDGPASIPAPTPPVTGSVPPASMGSLDNTPIPVNTTTGSALTDVNATVRATSNGTVNETVDETDPTTPLPDELPRLTIKITNTP